MATPISALDSTPTLDVLIEHARTTRWYILGVLLRLEPSRLEAIKTETHDEDERLSKMYEKWLASNPNATYNDVIEGLKKKPLEEIVVASKLERYLDRSKNNPDNTANSQSKLTKPNSGTEIIHEMESAANLQSDEVFTALALKLQEEYRNLLAKIQEKAEAGNLEIIKSVVKSMLIQKSTSLSDVNGYIILIDHQPSIDHLFHFLVNSKFIGYLNPEVLFDISAMLDDDDLRKNVKQYKDQYWKFISQPSFKQLVDVFDKNRNLQPSTVPGLPTFVVYLTDAWHSCSMNHLVKYLPFVQECKVQLDAIGLKCVMITFSVFPVYLKKLKLYLNDAEFIAECKKNGIEFEMSGLKNKITETATDLEKLDNSFATEKESPMKLWNALKTSEVDVKLGLLIMAGLPNSGVSFTLEEIWKSAATFGLEDAKQEGNEARFTHSQAIVSALKKKIAYAKVSSDQKAYLHVIIAGLVEHYRSIHGEVTEFMFIKDYEEIFSGDDVFSKQLQKVFELLEEKKNLFVSSASSSFESSLLDGMGLVNVWDFTFDKAAYNFLHLFNGHFCKSYMWLFMDLERDHKKMHLHPDPDDSANKPGAVDMVWRSRLHYLLRLCKMCQTFNSKQNAAAKVCHAFAMHKTDSFAEVKRSRDKIAKVFKDGVKVVGVDDVFDGTITDVPRDVHFKMKKFVSSFESLLLNDDHDQKVPLIWLFLRMLMNGYGSGMFLKRAELAHLAKKCDLPDDKNSLDKLCKFFTSFGSIFDINLVNDDSDIIIAQPSEFLKCLGKFYYGEASKKMRRYGIATRNQIADLVFGEFMKPLIDVGLAVEVRRDHLADCNWLPDDDRFDLYYIPSIRDCEPETSCRKGAVQLVLDVKSRPVNMEVAIVKKLLSSDKVTVQLKPCETVNITQLVVGGCNVTLTSQGDALEIYLDPPDGHEEEKQNICFEIVECVKDCAAGKKGLIYHYGVVCAVDSLKKNAYNVYHRRHMLPTSYFCFKCMEEGYYNRTIVNAWNAALHKNELYKDFFFINDLDDCSVKLIANTLSSLDDQYLVEVFLGELGCYDVKGKKCLKPEYISKKINQWKVRDHEVNEGVSPRNIITRKLLKIYNCKTKEFCHEKIKEIARELDFQVFTSEQINEITEEGGVVKKEETEQLGETKKEFEYNVEEEGPEILNMSAIQEVLPFLIEQEGKQGKKFVLDTAKLIKKDEELNFKFECPDIVDGTGQKESVVNSLRAKKMTISLETIRS